MRHDPNERLEFFRPAALPGTEVMAVYESSRRWHVFHERYAFCACHRVEASTRYRGREDRVSDSALAVREPGETHTNTFVGKPATFKTLYVEAPLLEEAARELGCPAPHFPHLLDTRDAALFPALDGLCGAIEARAEPLEQQSRFTAVVAAFLRHAEDPPAAPAAKQGKLAVERAKAHLRKRFSEAVSLQELALVSGLSRFHLVHAFTREVGLAPHAYQIHVRVERARSLLRGGIPPVEVAANVGFSDQSHLTRHFKRITHVTPSEYARAMRKQ